VNAVKTGKQALTVQIADDSHVIRERLGGLLREVPDVSVVAETGEAKETLDAVRRLTPAVLILDLSMPGGSGLEVLRQMSRDRLATVVIVLTNFPFPEYKKEALRHGAVAFLNKSSEFMKVIEFVRQLTTGGQLPTPVEAGKEAA
jgi:DNA-binding NarL/FixJ family response regulator